MAFGAYSLVYSRGCGILVGGDGIAGVWEGLFRLSVSGWVGSDGQLCCHRTRAHEVYAQWINGHAMNTLVLMLLCMDKGMGLGMHEWGLSLYSIQVDLHSSAHHRKPTGSLYGGICRFLTFVSLFSCD